MAGLIQVKLRGLVSANFGALHESAVVRGFNGGSAIESGGVGYAYINQSGSAALGAALVWATSVELSHLHVMLDNHAGVAARQAAMLSPAPTVWQVDGTNLVAATPVPHQPLAPLDPAVEKFRTALEEAGVEVVESQGDLVGEVLGLEVARVTPDGNGGATLRVGVGEFDQEAHAMMGGGTVLPRLKPVVDEVRSHRSGASTPHAVNRLARERWLRQVLLAEPQLVHATGLSAVPDLEERNGIKDNAPTALRGTDVSGDSVLVVCAVGIDLSLIPVAADYLAEQPADRVVLVIPDRDHHPLVDRLAAMLTVPTTIVSIANPWPV